MNLISEMPEETKVPGRDNNSVQCYRGQIRENWVEPLDVGKQKSIDMREKWAVKWEGLANDRREMRVGEDGKYSF